MKASIKINQDEWMLMSDIIATGQLITRRKKTSLEMIIVLEFYEKNLGRFHFIRDTTKSFKMSEILAWYHILMVWPMEPGYTDILRNNLLSKLNKSIEVACPGINIIKNLETSI